MKQGQRIQGFARKAFVLLLVSGALLAVSVLTTAMVSTATFTSLEAGGVIGSIPVENRSNALWAFIIPAAFFLVLSTRNWKPGGRKPGR